MATGWAIVRAAETTQDAAMLLLPWRGGLRRGEIPPLRVENVDFSDRHIRMHENYVHGIITSPKGKSERFMPVNKKVWTALDELLKERGDPPGDALLFPGDDGEMLDPRLVYTGFKNAVAKAGVRGVTSARFEAHLRFLLGIARSLALGVTGKHGPCQPRNDAGVRQSVRAAEEARRHG